jgi:hypothetical protein
MQVESDLLQSFVPDRLWTQGTPGFMSNSRSESKLVVGEEVMFSMGDQDRVYIRIWPYPLLAWSKD